MQRILVVDDDELSLVAGKRLLEKSGFSVTTALNGEDGLSLLDGLKFDIVLMDIQMPVLDGVEATRRIRAGLAGEANRSIPVVAMTAYAMGGDKEKFLAAGMDDYISKPVDMAELMGIIGRLAEAKN